MTRRIRPRLTYANVVSGLALFVALATGGAYAANTVFSADIVDGEVKTRRHRTGSGATDEKHRPDERRSATAKVKNERPDRRESPTDKLDGR